MCLLKHSGAPAMQGIKNRAAIAREHADLVQVFFIPLKATAIVNSGTLYECQARRASLQENRRKEAKLVCCPRAQFYGWNIMNVPELEHVSGFHMLLQTQGKLPERTSANTTQRVCASSPCQDMMQKRHATTCSPDVHIMVEACKINSFL